MSVRLVLLSHSETAARGVAELAGQVAGEPDVLVPVGGTDDGRLGTSADRLEAVVREALDAGYQVVVLADLGSAVLTARAVMDDLDDDPRVRLADAPFLEGAVSAAVSVSVGSSLEDVVAAAEEARGMHKG